MDAKLSRAAADFIIGLTRADTSEVGEYAAEFALDREFQNGIEEKRRAQAKARRFSYGYGIGPELGLVLYIICRIQKPDIVVETGVSSGVSSSHILAAFERNRRGGLYSIDAPWGDEDQSGWLIPDYLRDRWHLTIGRSSQELEPLLRKVKEIDIFLHDSDHSYRNMAWEFQTSWKYLKAGGLLLAHNIDSNEAFSDFYRNRHVEGYYLAEMGGMVKPKL